MAIHDELSGKRFASHSDALEWAEWEIEKVERSMQAVSSAIGACGDSRKASIGDSNIDSLMCLFSERLNAARKAINAVIGEI